MTIVYTKVFQRFKGQALNKYTSCMHTPSISIYSSAHTGVFNPTEDGNPLGISVFSIILLSKTTYWAYTNWFCDSCDCVGIISID